MQIEIRNEIINNLNKELSTKSRVMGDCQARFREKGGWKSLYLLDPNVGNESAHHLDVDVKS